MIDQDSRLHPTPQLARSQWTDLCGTWGFAYDDHNVGLGEGWQGRDDVYGDSIKVPFPPESPASGIGDPSFHPVVWYRRTFQINPGDAGKCILLHCGAVDYRAQVWVNGQLVATHEGGQTPFQADITHALQAEGEQSLVIRAEDLPRDLSQPRGKQDWEEKPHRIWYNRTTGIWQPVWLEVVANTHITRLRWTPRLNEGVLRLEVALRRQSQDPASIRIQLSLHGQSLVDDTYLLGGAELQRDIALDLGALTMSRQEILWSPEHPNLLDATLTVLSGDAVVDEVYSYVGLRSVDVQGGRFLLNDRPFYLRLALEQGYWPESYLASPSEEALSREVEVTKELGFNGVRIHQKVEDPRFLYWCDRLGLLVWGEIGSAYVFSEPSVERLTSEWMEVLERDYSHPCIAAWVPLNESWGVPSLLYDRAQQDFLHALFHLTKALDPTRPVVANDGWEYLTGDVFGIHDYTFSGDTIKERYGSLDAIERTLREVQPHYRFVALNATRREGVPFMLTEFGGIGFQPERDIPWFGYGTVGDPESFVAKYRELVDAVLECSAIAGFCYTQLTDTAQETNGLLTENREHKVDPGAIRSITRRPSAAVPGDIIAELREMRGTAFSGAGLGGAEDTDLSQSASLQSELPDNF